MERKVPISGDWSILFFILIVSLITLSSSQSDPPRNIETFYPLNYTPPPAPSNGLGRSGASKKAILTAVGATAASTLLLAAVFFILFTWFSRSRRRRKDTGNGVNSMSPLPAAGGSRSEYRKLGKNVKGYIVDEDGLDVLYWKKLSDSVSGGFYKEAYNTNSKRPPLPRGRSSSSHAEIQQALVPTASNAPAGAPKPASVPPPPPPSLKAPAAPPPPSVNVPAAPPPRKTLEAGGRWEGSGNGNAQVKLKALHWEKVNINSDQSMVWDQIEKGSFQYNGDMMEALFGVMATNRRSPKKSESGAGEASNSNPRIFILDTRKSQNTAIVIKSLGIPVEELIDSLLQGKGLTPDILEKLARMAPTKEEASQIMAFNGDPMKLADAELFLYSLLKAVPWGFARVDEMLFRLSYGSEMFRLTESLQTMESACEELRNRGIFLKLLEAILKAGNRLNAGTARGDAKAFNLSTLRKLSDYKSSDGKTTLLHFVVHEVVRNEGRRCLVARTNSIGRNNAQSSEDPTTKEEREREFLKLGLPVVGGLSSEFSNVNKAATIDYDSFKGTLDSLATNVREARQLLRDAQSDSADATDAFYMERGDFFESAEVEINAVEEEHARIMNLVKRTTQYYQAGSSNDKTPLQLFLIVKDFLATVDQTCLEIARSSQQKKQAPTEAASISQPAVLRSRVSFPKLPQHFLSDKSSSASDEDS